MRRKMHWIVVVATAALMAACGGGSSEPEFGAVKVAGDSLADSGTFGLKFTVQGSKPVGAGATPIWPELVAADYDIGLCPHYLASGANTFSVNAGCSNYAIGGGRINNLNAPNSPVSITQQLKALGSAGFGQRDLVLIDGGGNDVADLIKAYLAASSDRGASLAAMLSTVLDEATVQALLSQGQSGMAQAGGAYMQALASQFAGTIQTQVLDKGAKRVVVLNMPDVTLTPQFGFVLAAVAQSQGPQAAEQLRQLFGNWVQAFNATLAARFKDSKTVAIADFDARLKALVAQPAKYQLSNTRTPACPVVGQDGSGLPSYDFPSCTADALSRQTPPPGASGADWWQGYLFSDSFHPTPRGHRILADLVREALR
ncbi:SGNH/GDSL hydrolase family protein [Comamonas sp. NLF-1-9]|uniref:SGNH/GDSL hydrolase family protein n=1 Tax=Comamonas sp. NLF-1-9 TaxID=2853163 RepID=UPI001C48F18D|nr:SGNH/GDSL hydrolase family protein [Comamonas sp. NLF-1-9]QXL83834.1 SGNH/GDSL hydrolase family protein [Comamonas sp. NLF-1-9]